MVFTSRRLLARSLTPLLALLLLGLQTTPWAQTMPATPAVPSTTSSATGLTVKRAPPKISPEVVQTIELIELKRYNDAQEKIEGALKAKPRDAQWRFLEGVLYAETSQDQKAINAFESLREEFPELAEPYNNLAVLYQRRGEYQRARVALEQAIVNRPGYALAYENLGDLYAKLALQTYEKGLSAKGASPFLSAKRGHLEKLPQPSPLSIQPRLQRN
jgi:tetratricopeptide (TPR) repeat protein